MTEGSGRSAIASIHDVGPATLDRVAGLMRLLDRHDVWPRTLLVVPGRSWSPADLERIHGWMEDGVTLAGHGWSHQAPEATSLHHRLHAALISRDQAEHLSRPREELRSRVRECHAWFGAHGLPEPELYVPPAWALGALEMPDLAELPFRWYEILSGFVEARRGRLRRLPLIGFEADTTFRRVALRATNRLARMWGRVSARPVRISLHPDDRSLLLARELERTLAGPWRWVGEDEVMASPGPDPTRPSAPSPPDP